MNREENSQTLKNKDILEQIKKRLPGYVSLVEGVPYETKGILSSEILFMISCIPDIFTGQIIESGRARGQSTLILAMAFLQSRILSIELNEDSPDVPVAMARLKGYENVSLVYGDSNVILPTITKEGDVVLIDGPKMFAAVRLALTVLQKNKPVAVFIHDVDVTTPERKFLDMFLPESRFSDRREFAETSAFLDAADALLPTQRMGGFSGEYGYGFSLAYIPYVKGRQYTLLLLASYLFDLFFRVLRKLSLIK